MYKDEIEYNINVFIEISKNSHIKKALPLTISSLGSFIKIFKYLDPKSNGITESLLGGFFQTKERY